MAEKLKALGYFPIFFDLSESTGTPFSEADLSGFDRVYRGIKLPKKKIHQLSPLNKVLVSALNAIMMIFSEKKEKCTLRIIGVPLLTYRIANSISGKKVKCFSYIRGIIVKSGESTSLSSKVFLKYGFLKSIFGYKVFSDYYADQVLCVGNITKKFVVSRDVPEENVKVVGSIYCDAKYASKRPLEASNLSKPAIIFLSSAFARHGYIRSQAAQLELISKISNYLKTRFGEGEVEFIVRTHPREDINLYQGYICPFDLVDSSGKDPLMSYPEKRLFISPMSTMLFELAYLGELTALIGSNDFLDEHGDWYEGVGAQPILEWEKVIEKFFYGKLVRSHCNEALNLEKNISSVNKGRVIDEILGSVLNLE